jgi:hypothetical protein
MKPRDMKLTIFGHQIECFDHVAAYYADGVEYPVSQMCKACVNLFYRMEFRNYCQDCPGTARTAAERGR